MQIVALSLSLHQVKVIAGLGTTVDVILRNGILKEGDTLVLTGTEGPFSTQVSHISSSVPPSSLTPWGECSLSTEVYTH